MTCPGTRHKTMWDYWNNGCRCPEVKDAANRYKKELDLRRLRGIHGKQVIPQWRVLRRVRALARMGWTTRAVNHAVFGGQGAGNWYSNRGMLPSKFAQLDAFYQAHCMEWGGSREAATRALRRRWPAPLDWVNIDDPDEKATSSLYLALQDRGYRQAARERAAA